MHFIKTLLKLLLACCIFSQTSFAWDSTDVGIAGAETPGTTVSSSPSAHVLTSYGSGFGSTSEKLRLTSRDTYGNVEIEARIAGLTGPATSEAGVMIRQSDAANAAFVFVGITQDRELRYRSRTANGVVSTMSLGRYVSEDEDHQIWLRLMKSGNSLAAYYSADGIHWEVVGASTMALSRIFKAGVVTTAGFPGSSAEAQFDHALVIENVPQRYSDIANTTLDDSVAIPALWLRSDWNLNSDANGRILKWEDFSGYANDAVATAASKPLLIKNAIGLKPVARFESTSALADRKFLSIPHHASLSPADVSVFVVAKWNTEQFEPPLAGQLSHVQAGLISKGGSTTGYTLGFNAGVPRLIVPATSFTNELYGSVVATGTHLVSGIYRKTLEPKGLSVFVDGTSSPTPYATKTASIAASPNASFFIGQYLTVPTATNPTVAQVFPFIGDIAEILVFDRGITEAQRVQVEAYFRAKYQIATPITKLTPPAIPPPQQIYPGPKSITFSPAEGTQIYYQINGGPAQLYTGAVTVGEGKNVITAWSVLPGYENSDPVTATYVIDSESQYVARDGLQLWLRADAGLKTESGEVTEWQSQSSSFTAMAGSTARPSLLSSAAGIDGHPALTFSADRLSVANASDSSLALGKHTVCVVARAGASTPVAAAPTGAISTIISRATAVANPTSGYLFGLKATGTNASDASLQFQAKLLPVSAPNTEGALTPLPTELNTNEWAVLLSSYDLQKQTIQINGGNTAIINRTAAVGNPGTALLVGGHTGTNASFYGDIAEILVYDQELSAADLRKLQVYLNLRYKIPGTQLAPEVDLQVEPKPGLHPIIPTVTCSSQDNAAITYIVNGGELKTGSSINLATETAEMLPGSVKRYEVKISASKDGFTDVTDRTFVYFVDPSIADVSRSNMKLWLRADLDASPGTGPADSVNRWSDVSGTGNDVMASPVTAAPLKVASSLNGKPAVSFGSPDGLGITQMIEVLPGSAWPGLGAVPNDDITVIAIVKDNGSADNAVIVEQETENDAAGFALRLRQESSGRSVESRINASTLKAKKLGANFPAPFGFNLVVQRAFPVGSTRHALEVNKIASNSQLGYAADSSSAARLFSLGARRTQTTALPNSLPVNGFQGEIAELLVFDTALTDLELSRLESYLVNRYDLNSESRGTDSRVPLPGLAMPDVTPSIGVWGVNTKITATHIDGNAVTLSYRFALDETALSAASWVAYTTGFVPNSPGRHLIEVMAERAGYASATRKFELTFDPAVQYINRDNLVVWLAADHIKDTDTEVVGSKRVTRWRDLSGRGNDALPVNTGQGPDLIDSTVMNYRTSDTPPVKAKAVSFPLSTTDRRLKITDSADLASAKTVFLVSRSEATGDCVILQKVSAGSNGSLGGWQLIYNDEGGKVGIGPLAPFATPVETTGAETPQPQLTTAVVGKGIHLLGTTLSRSAGTSWGAGDSGDDLFIGGSEPFSFTGNVNVGSEIITNISAAAMQRIVVGMIMTGPGGNISGKPIDSIVNASSIEAGNAQGNSYVNANLTATSYMVGEIAEMIIYSTELNDADAGRVHDYLIRKYTFQHQPQLPAPVIAVEATGGTGQPNSVGGVYKEPRTVTITADAGTTVHYQKDNGVEQAATTSVSIAVDVGTTRFSAWSTRSGYSQSATTYAQVVIEPDADLVAKNQLLLWVNSGSALTDSSSNVTKWLDLSGNAHHLAKPTDAATKHPKLVTTPSGNPFNGHPAVEFKAADKSCLEGNYAALDAGNVSIFAVLRRPTSTSTSPMILGEKWQGSNGYTFQYIPSSSTFRFGSDAATTGLTYSVAGTASVALAGATHGDTARRLYHQGNLVQTAQLSTPDPTDPSGSPFYIGGRLGTLSASSEIAEMWVWGKELTEEEINALSVYAYKKYGTPTNKQVPAPTVVYEGGTYSAPLGLKVSCSMPGTTIEYEIRTNPAVPVPDPTSNSPSFLAADITRSTLSIDKPYQTLKIRATRPNFIASEVKEWTFRIEPDKNVVRQGLVAWFRGDRGVDTNPNLQVDRWSDQSGLANDAMPPVGATYRATYVTNPVGTVSMPVVRFNEAGYTQPVSLQIPHDSIRFPDAQTTFQTMSAIAVVRKLGINSGGLIVKKGGYQLRVSGTEAAPTASMQINAETTWITVPIRGNTFEAISGSYDRVIRRVSNSETVATGAATAATSQDTNPIFIGASATGTNAANLQGEIAELLIYNRGLSASESQQMERYLQNEYGIFNASQVTIEKPHFFPAVVESTLALAAPQEVGLSASPGLEIYYTTDPALASTPSHTTWTPYAQPIQVGHSATITAFCRRPGTDPVNGPTTWATFTLDPVKYPAPVNNSSDSTPPTITLEKPTNATLITTP